RLTVSLPVLSAYAAVRVKAAVGATVMVQPCDVVTTAPAIGMVMLSESLFGSVSLALSTNLAVQAPLVTVFSVPLRLSLHGATAKVVVLIPSSNVGGRTVSAIGD